MSMAFYLLNLFGIVVSVAMITGAKADSTFDQIYKPLWGFKHVSVQNQGREVQLLFDSSSGAGFRSKSDYCYGSFKIRMKISEKRTGGVVSCFYLTSSQDNSPGNHDEIDFEFVGTDGTLQTNVFANDQGHREERIQLWFDPSKDFHTYEIVWNAQQVVFSVDNSPIRVFKKNPGVNFSLKPMHVEATIWNANWAGSVDWSKAPFIAYYQGFSIAAKQTNLNQLCSSSSFSDENMEQWALNPAQQKQYEDIRRKYLRWDYCSDKSRYHPECATK